MADPYVYQGTNVLINKFDIKNSADLKVIEYSWTNRREKEYFEKTENQKLNFDYKHLKQVNKSLFQDVYDWAGKERTVNITKGNTMFAFCPQIQPSADKLLGQLSKENNLKNLSFEDFTTKAAYYFAELNVIHPFREGNGRTQKVFFQDIARNAGHRLDWTKISYNKHIEAVIQSYEGDYKKLTEVFKEITKFNDLRIKKYSSLKKEKKSGMSIGM